MRPHSYIPVYAIISLLLVFLPSCKKNSKLDNIPRTDFIRHYEPNVNKNTPFLAVWVDEKVKTRAQKKIKNENEHLFLYIKPVTLKYLLDTKSTIKYKEDIEKLKQRFDQKLLSYFQKKDGSIPRFHLAARPSQKTYTLEVAIIDVKPTPVARKIVSETIGVVESAAGALAGTMKGKGYIVMNARFRSPEGKTLAEIADYASDKSALIVDFKDFKKFAHHRNKIDIWSREIADTFTSPPGTKIKGESRITLIPF